MNSPFLPKLFHKYSFYLTIYATFTFVSSDVHL